MTLARLLRQLRSPAAYSAAFALQRRGEYALLRWVYATSQCARTRAACAAALRAGGVMPGAVWWNDRILPSAHKP